ncbi:MAG: DNRLRE domain-containing protein [Magnetococcales bacterium]|nr:DNRLRE domain-containing protein [Magnetococcales bacterium]
MRPTHYHHSMQSGSGFILMPVLVILATVSSMVFLVHYETSMSLKISTTGFDNTKTEYATRGADVLAQWSVDQVADCSSYSVMPSRYFGDYKIAATVSPSTGSPVTITSSSTNLTTGTSYTTTQTVERYNDGWGQWTVIQPDGITGVDAFIQQDSPTTNKGGDSNLVVNSETTKSVRSLVKFPLDDIPEGSEIAQAIARFYLNSGTGASEYHYLHAVTSEWFEDQVTGTNLTNTTTWGSPLWTNPPADLDWPETGFWVAGTSSGWKSADITTEAQAWFNGTRGNYGLMIYADPQAGNNEKIYTSSDDGTASLRPKLEVFHTCPCNVCPYVPPDD